MKRGKPLKRKTQLKRTSIKRKARKHGNPALQAEWASEHESCACCWFRAGQFGSWLETDHILGGKFGRPDHRANYLRLCHACHSLKHGARLRGASGDFLPEISIAHCLAMKLESDPENYDLEVLQAFAGKWVLPEPEPLPEALLALRCT